MSRAENIVYILEDFYYNYFIWYVILEFISLTNSVRNSQKAKEILLFIYMNLYYNERSNR